MEEKNFIEVSVSPDQEMIGNFLIGTSLCKSNLAKHDEKTRFIDVFFITRENSAYSGKLNMQELKIALYNKTTTSLVEDKKFIEISTLADGSEIKRFFLGISKLSMTNNNQDKTYIKIKFQTTDNSGYSGLVCVDSLQMALLKAVEKLEK